MLKAGLPWQKTIAEAMADWQIQRQIQRREGKKQAPNMGAISMK